MNYDPTFFPNEEPSRVHLDVTTISEPLINLLYNRDDKQLRVPLGDASYYVEINLAGMEDKIEEFDNGHLKIYLSEAWASPQAEIENFQTISKDYLFGGVQEDYDILKDRLEMLLVKIPEALA